MASGRSVPSGRHWDRVCDGLRLGNSWSGIFLAAEVREMENISGYFMMLYSIHGNIGDTRT